MWGRFGDGEKEIANQARLTPLCSIVGKFAAIVGTK
jgi:hypothetical protein